ncbi:hypothetical protein HYH03_000578 [Edaphochlamys debaryana]|uniref:Uncharacterized protein n=1 Tax=Edaphochlamys debaryana TaxID=47281 RepID=A0A835YJG9_9CHLO|nr:hypothetical protein HYH03_000578 [Edaphochlamys debaryana]|eukprot:KAG2502086.1 hypothetical protein HYH03_000578 [Edaphochlamys debaryana]
MRPTAPSDSGSGSSKVSHAAKPTTPNGPSGRLISSPSGRVIMASASQHLDRILFAQPSIHTTLFEDRVFGHEDWKRYRSASWRHRVEPVVFLRVAAGFVWQLVLVLVVSVCVGLLHTFVPSFDAWLEGLHLSTPFTMVTFALSLLLVFRTNSSYSRWWEGRIIWGQVVNFGRNYTRQALMWFPPERPDLRAAAVRWAAAAPRILLAHIREGASPLGEARGVLTEAELSWLAGWSNAPLGAGTALGQLVAAAGLAPQLQAELQKQVELYTNMAGGCERIFKTPIPPAYTRHTSRYLMLYVVTAPLLLWSSTGWATPVVAVVIAFLLLGVENIGVQVEEPFHVLPLYDICRALEANIRELEHSFAPPPSAPPPPPPPGPWASAPGAVGLAARAYWGACEELTVRGLSSGSGAAVGGGGAGGG